MAAAVEIDHVSKSFRLYREKYTSLKERLIHLGRVPFEDFIKHSASQIPVQRVGQPEDIAATISFLCSEEAGFVSGQVIYVAGGPLD